MKKKILAVLLSAATVLTMAACGTTATSTDTSASASTDGGSDAATSYTYDIKVWCPEAAVDLTTKQISDFNSTNTDGITLNATVEAVGEGDAATTMIQDVESGADLYFFAQDQTSRLLEANALMQLGDAAAEYVKTSFDEAGVAAASVGDGAVYAYPLTSDNGYFMFYDKSVIPEEDLDSMEALIADCEAAGKTFCFQLEGSSWYTASFFFATGCDSTWETDDEGNFISVNDTFNSDKGLLACEGMYKLLSSSAWVDSSETSEFEAAIPAAIVVSGTWNTANAKSILGDNLGATDLPSFTAGGVSYHLGSYNGCKLLGVKPQEDAAKAACLNKLAQYLTSASACEERYNELLWGPSNLEAQSSSEVSSDLGVVAVNLQNAYAKTQGNIHGSWWDIAKVIATTVKESNGTTEEFQTALTAYEDTCQSLFNMTSDEKEAFSVIGTICGTNWDTDLPMTRTAETGDPTYYSEALELKAGDEFKVRQGASWDVNFGKDGVVNGDNIVVEEDGIYYVKLVTAEDLSSATISLEKHSFYGWNVIGTLNGSNWDTDFGMDIQDDGTTFKLADVTMTAGTEFKVRYANSWDVNYGKDGVAGGDNVVVDADGTYTIVFDSTTGVITLE